MSPEIKSKAYHAAEVCRARANCSGDVLFHTLAELFEEIAGERNESLQPRCRCSHCESNN